MGAVFLGLAFAVWSWLDVAEPPQPGPIPPPGPCAPGAAPGGLAPGLLLRRPVNHAPARPYPLVVAFPPAGMRAAEAERFYDLTGSATRAGFLVAYSDAIPPSRLALNLQGAVAARVAASTCVDAGRVAFFGHSDGGALAEMLALRPGPLKPRALFASAAGVTRDDLVAASCPVGLDALIAHNRADARFPDFGRGAASYFAACGGCAPDSLDDLAQGCRDFRACGAGSLRYCATDAPHARFGPLRRTAAEFLIRALAR